jgi:hypothetical protein
MKRLMANLNPQMNMRQSNINLGRIKGGNNKLTRTDRSVRRPLQSVTGNSGERFPFIGCAGRTPSVMIIYQPQTTYSARRFVFQQPPGVHHDERRPRKRHPRHRVRHGSCPPHMGMASIELCIGPPVEPPSAGAQQGHGCSTGNPPWNRRADAINGGIMPPDLPLLPRTLLHHQHGVDRFSGSAVFPSDRRTHSPLSGGIGPRRSPVRF